MSVSLAFALTLWPAAVDQKVNCSELLSEQQQAHCEYLRRTESLEVRTVESVAVGSEKQMSLLRAKARQCGLSNRIDYVGPKVSVFDIINAKEAGRRCFMTWIETHEPQLVFSEEKLQRLISANSAPDDLD